MGGGCQSPAKSDIKACQLTAAKWVNKVSHTTSHPAPHHLSQEALGHASTRAHPCTRKTRPQLPKRHGFQEPNAGPKLSPHVAPAATRSAASRRSHPEQQRGRPPSGGGLRGGKDRSVPSASAGCVRFDDDKIICMYLASHLGCYTEQQSGARAVRRAIRNALFKTCKNMRPLKQLLTSRHDTELRADTKPTFHRMRRVRGLEGRGEINEKVRTTYYAPRR